MPTGISGQYYNTRGAREHKRKERFSETDITNMTFAQIWEDGYSKGFEDGIKCVTEESEDDGK